MHDERRRIEERVERAHNQRIKPAIYAATAPFTVEAWQAPGEPVSFDEAAAAPYAPFAMDTPWGPPWGTTWFRMHGQVPAEWAGRRVEAVIDLGFTGDWPGNQAEALVHLTDGTPLKAVNPLNQYVAIANPAEGGEVVDYLVEAASNPDILANDFSEPTPLGDVLTAGDRPLYTFRRADLAVLDEEVFHLDLDVQVLRELMLELGEHDPRRHEIMHALDRALDLLDLDDVAGSAADVRAALKPVLAKPAHASAHIVSGVGHAHIDSAWLWPIRETKRKTSRTFSNVTSLADEYEDFIFACSQAQQYEWVRDNYPQVWARIQESVKRGQWAPVGGMWVESDGNLPGGEAIARQLVHGKRFFIEHFGIETKGVWLPDSFGYNAAYPQLAKLAGNEWFLTQKISWNQTNKFPHHTFWWEGIDGTRIFTHFPPVDTYNARFSGEEMSRAVRNYQEKGNATRSLAPFGWGDGGGGPTREIMERARRLADLEGSPKVVVEHPDEFFAKARAEYPDAPVWVGELYLELHRATYTSQARTKGQPAQRTPAPRGRVVGDDGRAVRAGLRVPVREARQAVEDGAAAPVPRHPAGLLDRLGAPRGRGRIRARGNGVGGADGNGRGRAGRRRDPGLQHQPLRPRRGDPYGDRCADVRDGPRERQRAAGRRVRPAGGDRHRPRPRQRRRPRRTRRRRHPRLRARPAPRRP